MAAAAAVMAAVAAGTTALEAMANVVLIPFKVWWNGTPHIGIITHTHTYTQLIKQRTQIKIKYGKSHITQCIW